MIAAERCHVNYVPSVIAITYIVCTYVAAAARLIVNACQ